MKTFVEFKAKRKIGECPICLEAMDNHNTVIVTNCCSKFFHKSCVETLKECPLCRGQHYQHKELIEHIIPSLEPPPKPLPPTANIPANIPRNVPQTSNNNHISLRSVYTRKKRSIPKKIRRKRSSTPRIRRKKSRSYKRRKSKKRSRKISRKYKSKKRSRKRYRTKSKKRRRSRSKRRKKSCNVM